MQDAFQSLYRKVLLDHSRSPRHHGVLPDPTHQGIGHNARCGDNVVIALRLHSSVLEGAMWTGEGCALMTASASLLLEAIQGLSPPAIHDLLSRLKRLFDEAPPSDDLLQSLGDLAFFSSLRQFPLRQKCACLPWSALSAALQMARLPVSTEDPVPPSP